MASTHLPTRRVTRTRNLNENTVSTRVTTRSKDTATSAAPTAHTTKSAMANATAAGPSKKIAVAVDADAPPAGDNKRKRNALNDLTKTHANNDKTRRGAVPADKDVKPKKPLAGASSSKVAVAQDDAPQPRRRSLRTAGKVKIEEEPAAPAPAVTRPLKTRTKTAAGAIKKTTAATRRVVKVETFEDELAPEPKRQRTSSPGVEEEVKREAERLETKEEARRAKAQPAKDEGWEDLDAEDEGDPLMVSEYVVEIFEYMKALEAQTMPNPDYMSTQKELRWKMRGVLVDWLIEVHHKFRLLPETLFLAINIVDRFLSLRIVSVVKLQLVGLTAMFVAAKYEEVMCPSVANFLFMADGGYTEQEILKAEAYVLQVLGFDMSYPNPIHFLRRVSKADEYDIETRTLAKYFMEISCVDERLLSSTPSVIAAAGVYLARMVLERGEWNPNLVHYSGFSVAELLPTAQIMLDYVLSKEIRHESFHKKYASKKFLKASVFVRDWAMGRWGAGAPVDLSAEVGVDPVVAQW